MVKLILKPFVCGWDPLEVARVAEGLLINGELLDLTPLSEGDCLPDGSVGSKYVKEISLDGGVLNVELILPLSDHCKSPASCFPTPILVGELGPVKLPVET